MGGELSSWSSGADGGAKSQFCIAGTLCSVTTSFTAMSLLLFRLTYLQFWSRQVLPPERKGKQFKYRILCTLVLSRENPL